MLVLGEALFHIDQILFDGQHFLVNGALRGEPLVLRQVPVRAVSFKRDRALVGDFLPDNDPQKSRLPGPVDTYDGGFIAPFQVKGDVAKDDIFGIFFTYVVTCKDHVLSLS